MAGRPTDESHTIWAMGIAADALTHLRAAKLPVKAVWAPEGAAVHWLLVVVPEDWRDKLPGVSSEEFAKQVGEVLFETDTMLFIPKVFLVDDDIDPANLSDVVWAISTRVHPRVGTRFPKINGSFGCHSATKRVSTLSDEVRRSSTTRFQPTSEKGRNLHCRSSRVIPESSSSAC
ncbi:hypothetical protein ACFVKB_41585 [Rhodococcus sp. NPDC127530]|uniref:hypothetical protein n=1 Tax=unclassified Rhodococcus (in: high G+C Gram-positive bacteria) TaxID=192944 RepID=UPI00364473EA